MKKKLVFTIISIVMTLIASISIVLAWYVNQSRTESIDATTQGISFTYQINGESEINQKNYAIQNLVFFDPQNSNELSYFLKMSTQLEIKIQNTSSNAFDYNVDFQSVKQVIQNAEEILSEAYVQAVFSNHILTDSDLVNFSTIEELVIAQNPFSGSLGAYQSDMSSVTFYVYLFGVQSIVTSNNDFLRNTYLFNLKFISQKLK